MTRSIEDSRLNLENVRESARVAPSVVIIEEDTVEIEASYQVPTMQKIKGSEVLTLDFWKNLKD